MNMIHPQAYVSPEAKIGYGNLIGPGTYIGPDVIIGDDCTIGPNVSIGWKGFGYVEQEDGTWDGKDHPYGVVIGNHVEIGANSCIDRGSWRHTIISSGTKIDNLVHVAHNVIIGQNCLLVAHVGLGGSVIVEDGVWVGFGAHVNQRLTLGYRSYIGTGAVVTKDTDPNGVYAGVPAKYIRERTSDDA